MVEIELKRRRLLRMTRRRREVVLALVASASVLTTVLVVALSYSDFGGEPDRSPGVAIGIEVPDSPLGVLDSSDPGGPGDPASSAVAGGDLVPGSSVSQPGAPGQGAGSSVDPSPAAQPADAGSGPVDPVDPVDPNDPADTQQARRGDDGPITTLVDPVLRDVGSTAPVVEPVRQVARGLTGCLDDALLLLQNRPVPGCSLPVRLGQ